MEKESKKALLAQYKERKVVGGVYSITNKMTGKKYVYTSMDLEGSKNRFTFARDTQSCIMQNLQKEWDEYGGDNFEYEVLESLEQGETQTAKEFKDDLNNLYAIVTAEG